MLNVAICDDNLMQTEIIQALLDKYQAERSNIELHTQSFHSGDDLLNYIDTGHRIDIYLLDILMPNKNGIDFARELRHKDTEAPLIFITSSKEHALEAFEVAATQYILKPITENKFFYVLDKIIISQRLEQRRFFALPAQGQIFNIPFASILYVEFVGRALAVHMLDGKTLIGNTVRVSFDNAVTALLEDERFLHAHKSFVLNMSHITALGYASFTMKNGSQVPIPAHRYSKVRDKYSAYLLKHGIVKK